MNVYIVPIGEAREDDTEPASTAGHKRNPGPRRSHYRLHNMSDSRFHQQTTLERSTGNDTILRRNTVLLW